MASVQPCTPSASLPTASEPWQSALSTFKNELTTRELALYGNARPENILEDLANLEKTQRTSSKTRRVMRGVKPLLDTVNDYGKALDVLANSQSVLPPLWGSLRVLLAVSLPKLPQLLQLSNHPVSPL